MNPRFFLLSATISLTFLSGCEYAKKIKIPEINLPKLTNIQKTVIEKKNISIICNRGSIDKYIKDGWKVVKKESKEVTCSWKVGRAKPGCNLKKDKGCRVTIPDTLGKEHFYQLERKKKLED